MAITVVKSIRTLDRGFVLTPERYNPNRKLQNRSHPDSIKLSDIVVLANEIISPKQAAMRTDDVLIINTGDAYEGHIRMPEKKKNIWNSNKKIVKAGDVIISRLRPYLRQIAYVDNGIFLHNETAVCAVSTEFYVMRAKDNRNIGFVVPLLLSSRVQSVFVNAVEGNQHPRFNDDVLLGIEIPKLILDTADAISASVVENISLIRQYETSMYEKTKMYSQYMAGQHERGISVQPYLNV